AAPQMRRLVETEIAAVVHRRQTLVGGLGIVDAVVTFAARHQRRNHHLRPDTERLAHEVFGELAAGLDDDAADLVSERERPRQLLRPMTSEDMQVRTANAAGADLEQRRLLRDFGPWHGANDRRCTRAVIRADTNLIHHCPPVRTVVIWLRSPRS